MMMKSEKFLEIKLVMQKLILGLALIILSSCTDAVCLDPDDFGFSSVKIPANYSSDKIHGAGERQFAEWYDSGLTLSGGPIHVVVKQWNLMYNINSSIELSAWCPWLGPSDNPPSLSDICMMLDKCDFQNNDPCSTGTDALITNAPCLMKGGVGLYMLAVPKDFDPNESDSTMQDPVKSSSAEGRAVLRHLGSATSRDSGSRADARFYDFQITPDETSSGSEILTGGAYINLTTEQRKNLVGGKLYFKVLDKHYDDNNGQYIVTVKSGVTSSEWDPTQFAVDLVKNFFFGSDANPGSMSTFHEPGIIKQMFENVISKPGYKLAVRSLLTLAIMFYAINFLIGNVKMTQHDLVFRIIKIIIVSQLISNNSTWTFFYTNFFTYFIDGSAHLIGIIKNTAGAGPGSSSLIALMLSPHAFIKLSALPFISPAMFGFSCIYVILYIVMLTLVFIGLFYSAVVYITCIVMMGFIISLAPIFLCFMLFEHTRSLFDNWLKQLMSYALQPLIVVTGVTLGSLMIRHQIYQTLGFRVCKKDIFNVDHHDNAFKKSIRGNDSRSVMAYYWAPIYSSSEELKTILIPEAHFRDVSGNKVSASDPGAIYCEPYMCTGSRYPSFPFLDPTDSADMKMLALFRNGNFASLLNILFLLIVSGLIVYFILGALKVASFITGGAANITGAAQASTQTLGKATMKAAKYSAKAAIGAGKMAWKGGKLGVRGIKAIVTKGKSEGLGGEGDDSGEGGSGGENDSGAAGGGIGGGGAAGGGSEGSVSVMQKTKDLGAMSSSSVASASSSGNSAQTPPAAQAVASSASTPAAEASQPLSKAPPVKKEKSAFAPQKVRR